MVSVCSLSPDYWIHVIWWCNLSNTSWFYDSDHCRNCYLSNILIRVGIITLNPSLSPRPHPPKRILFVMVCLPLAHCHGFPQMLIVMVFPPLGHLQQLPPWGRGATGVHGYGWQGQEEWSETYMASMKPTQHGCRLSPAHFNELYALINIVLHTFKHAYVASTVV